MMNGVCLYLGSQSQFRENRISYIHNCVICPDCFKSVERFPVVVTPNETSSLGKKKVINTASVQKGNKQKRQTKSILK